MSGRCAAAVVPALCFALLAAAAPASAAEAVERIVVIRHGEKPEAGLGQLACRGLSRALALPDVIIARFGPPQAVFAPNPAHKKPDRGHPYNYIRPLATIEPLAIRAGLPVDLRFGFDEFLPLSRALESSQYAGQLVIVAWEHKVAIPLLQDLLKRNGADAKQVQPWKDDDFDRMDVVEITRTAGQKPTATYSSGRQGLDGLPEACPTVKHP